MFAVADKGPHLSANRAFQNAPGHTISPEPDPSHPPTTDRRAAGNLARVSAAPHTVARAPHLSTAGGVDNFGVFPQGRASLVDIMYIMRSGPRLAPVRYDRLRVGRETGAGNDDSLTGATPGSRLRCGTRRTEAPSRVMARATPTRSRETGCAMIAAGARRHRCVWERTGLMARGPVSRAGANSPPLPRQQQRRRPGDRRGSPGLLDVS